MSKKWLEVVENALQRYSLNNHTIIVERSLFLQQELSAIIAETKTTGKTPEQTVSRILQELREKGGLYFSDMAGTYTLNQGKINAASEDLPEDVVENALLNNRLSLPDVEVSDYLGNARIRRGMGTLRAKTLANYRSVCALCDVTDTRLLVASHIVRWADCVESRGLLANVICFCTLHDKLFENGYFSIADNFNVIWKTPINSNSITIWKQSCTYEFKPPFINFPSLDFISAHRMRVGLG